MENYSNLVLMEKTYRLNNTFTEMVLSGGDIKDIVRVLAEYCLGEVKVYDTYNAVLAYEDAFSECCNDKDSQDKEEKDAAIEKIREEIIINNEIAAYICISKPEKQINELDRIALKCAANNLAFVLLIRQNAEEVQKNHHNEFLNDLVDGDIESKEEIVERGTLYEIDLSKPYILILINIKSMDEIFPSNNSFETHNLLRKIFKMAFRTFFSTAKDSIVWTRSNNIIVLYPLPEKFLTSKDIPQDDIKSFSYQMADKLKKTIEDTIENVIVTIGLGYYYSDISEISKSYRESLAAVKTGKSVWGHNRIYHYDDLGIYKILEKYPDRTELYGFVKNVLGNLIDYDKKHKTDYLHTLTQLIACNGKQKSAAEFLFIHPKTMAYRKRKIEDITEKSFDNADDFFDFCMALKIMKLLNKS